MHKTKLVGEIVAQPARNNKNGILKNSKIAVPLKYFIDFRRSLEMPLIN